MVNFEKYLHNKWMTLFMYCLLIATFVTVAIYVYAGEQQDLEKRKFGNVHVQKNLTLSGTERSQWEKTKVTGPATFTADLDPNVFTVYEFENSTDVTTVHLPDAKTVAEMFPEKKDGETIYLGFMYSHKSPTLINLDWTTNNSTGYSYSSFDTGIPSTMTLNRVFAFSFTWSKNADGTVTLLWYDARA